MKQNSALLKQLIVLTIGLTLSTLSFAETFECKPSANKEYANDKSFSAIIDINTNNETGNITAKVEKLKLSQSWALSEKCQSPLNPDNKILKGIKEEGSNEIKLSPKHDIECGFEFFFLQGDDENITLLSPRKSYQVYGESPYVAICNKIY